MGSAEATRHRQDLNNTVELHIDLVHPEYIMQRTRREATKGLLPDERQRVILEKLRANGRVLAADLALEFNTSEHTIRRHLRDLVGEGYCKRVYGGALFLSPDRSFASTRTRGAVDRKTALAVAAASIVRPGQIVLLDAGSINAAIAQALPDNANLTVLTNSPQACMYLFDRAGFKVVMIGGRMGLQGGGASGATALLQIQQVKADVCFLSECAVNATEGITGFDAEDAELKRAMLRSSRQIAVAVTSERLMTVAPLFVAPASAIKHLIVEPDVSPERLSALEQAFGNVVVARS